MVKNGQIRARRFTIDRIAARWREVLAGPVSEGFGLVWAQSSMEVFGPAGFFAEQAARNIYERRKYVKQRDHGFRPISGRFT